MALLDGDVEVVVPIFFQSIRHFDRQVLLVEGSVPLFCVELRLVVIIWSVFTSFSGGLLKER